jgi:hypothetical protein
MIQREAPFVWWFGSECLLTRIHAIGVSAPNMASRWRHVDSSPSISAADTTLLEEDVRLLFAKVYHKISWRDFYQLVLSYAAKLPTHLVELSSGRHGHTMSAPHNSSSSQLPEPRHGSPSEHLNK